MSDPVVNMSEEHEVMSELPPTRNTFGALLLATIASAGVHFTCPSSKLPLGIRLSANSPKSYDADMFRVLAYLTADQVLSPPLVVETVDFRILTSNLVPFGNGKFASIDIIIALRHQHARSARPWRIVSDHPHRSALSHRTVGYGDCRRRIRRAYAFGMVMYWV